MPDFTFLLFISNSHHFSLKGRWVGTCGCMGLKDGGLKDGGAGAFDVHLLLLRKL
jgi:hypothetical protein